MENHRFFPVQAFNVVEYPILTVNNIRSIIHPSTGPGIRWGWIQMKKES